VLVRRQRTRFELAGNTPCQPLADQDRVLTKVEDEQTPDGEVQLTLKAGMAELLMLEFDGAGGVTATPRATWARLLGHQNPGL
jgi:hypothetical protein